MKNSYTRDVSIRIKHPTWNADIFTETFHLKPEISQTVGKPRFTPTGIALEGVYKQTYWCYNINYEATNEVECVVSEFLKKMKVYRVFFEEMRETGGRAMIVICILSKTDFGLEFDNSTIEEMANLGISLGFDIYIEANRGSEKGSEKGEKGSGLNGTDLREVVVAFARGNLHTKNYLTN